VEKRGCVGRIRDLKVGLLTLGMGQARGGSGKRP
jgi:hypothetical protein